MKVRKRKESRVTSCFWIGKLGDFCGSAHRERCYRNIDLVLRFQINLLQKRKNIIA